MYCTENLLLLLSSISCRILREHMYQLQMYTLYIIHYIIYYILTVM